MKTQAQSVQVGVPENLAQFYGHKDTLSLLKSVTNSGQ